MISFNTNPNKMYIHAMEDDSNSEYRTGPIEAKIDESYWILTTVNNMCPDKLRLKKLLSRLLSMIR